MQRAYKILNSQSRFEKIKKKTGKVLKICKTFLKCLINVKKNFKTSCKALVKFQNLNKASRNSQNLMNVLKFQNRFRKIKKRQIKFSKTCTNFLKPIKNIRIISK